MFKATLLALLVVIGSTACGGTSSGGGIDPTPDANEPTSVRFGDTALVVVVNPVINDMNRFNGVPVPGSTKADITVSSDDGASAITRADGIAVLAPLTAGIRTFSVTGPGIAGSFTMTITSGTLHEIALAAEGARAEIMVNLDYKSDRVFEVVPTMTPTEVNDALKVSDRVVFFKTGIYTGDIDFSASRVTLFGEGVLGGTVTIQGNITISGSDSRIRGTYITGDLTIPASGTGLSFSRVDGTFDALGSDTTVLVNSLCGNNTITGSGSYAIGNAGLAPTPTCP